MVETIVTDDATPIMVRQRNLDDVVRVLEEARVPYFCLPSRNERRSVVAVPIDKHKKIISLLRSSPILAGAAVIHTEKVRLKGRPRAEREDLVVQVFRLFTNSGRTVTLGAQYACELEFWRTIDLALAGSDYKADAPSRRDGDGPTNHVIVGPRPNPVSDVAPLNAETVEAPAWVFSNFVPYIGEVPHYITRRDFARVRPDRVLFPIDAVYTWVDGSDPDWQMRKNAALHAYQRDTLNDVAASQSRYENRDELRYSLRSLVAFMPWIRHIYLVTDDQIPPWLDFSHPMITLVSHREIFGETGRLPTFNSHAIETRLHRIAGLSEHFVYFNDDMFIGRPLTPNNFFHANGIAKFFLSPAQLGLGEPTPLDAPVTAAGRNNRARVEHYFGRTITQKMRHVPYPLRRSVLEEIEAKLGDDVTETARHQFRHPRDLSIPSSLHHYWSYLTARAVPGRLRYAYLDLSNSSTPGRLVEILAERRQDVFCLNDTDSEGTLSDVGEMLSEFLAAYFPFRSPFELPDEAAGKRSMYSASELARQVFASKDQRGGRAKEAAEAAGPDQGVTESYVRFDQDDVGAKLAGKGLSSTEELH